MNRKSLFAFILVLLLIFGLCTVAFGDESDITVNVGPGYEVLDITVEESYDAEYGQIEHVTITWAPAESVVDAAAVVVLCASAIFLATMAYLRRKLSLSRC